MQNPDDFDLPRRTGAVAAFIKSLDIPGRMKARGPLFTIVPVILIAAITGGVVWYSYPRGTAFQQERPVPIIRADASPWKVAPQDPEGMDIPWRDSTVFDNLRGGGDDNVASRVENLLPEAEKPLERAALFTGAETAEPAAPVITTARAEPAKPEDITEDITAAAPAKTAVPAPAVKPAAAPGAVAAAPPQDEAAATAARTEPAAGAATGDYFVQLGSLSSPDNAQQSWKTLQGLFPKHLEGLGMRVQEADLGAKGKFYRVQGGPVAEGRAKAICEAVAAKRPGGCLVVHR